MKTPVLAAIDIGNSGLRAGVLRNGTLLAGRRLRPGASLGRLIRELVHEAHVARVDGAVICSVVPRRTAAAATALRRATGRTPLVIASRLTSGLRMRYRTPMTLGADRLCAAAAAYRRFGGPVIIVDLGTATTIDCVTRHGEYLGGAISPGIETSARALHAATAQLPMIPLEPPADVVGGDTRSSLQSGIIYGAIGALEGLLGRFRRVTGKRTLVVATGGLAPLVASQSAAVDIVRPHLVLEGAALVWERNRRK